VTLVVNGLRLTPGRLAWLRKLAISPADRPRGAVAFQCMSARLTEWNYCDREGNPVSYDEIRTLYPNGGWADFIRGERLTDDGRNALRLAEQKP
jgi:hypothetical protein